MNKYEIKNWLNGKRIAMIISQGFSEDTKGLIWKLCIRLPIALFILLLLLPALLFVYIKDLWIMHR